MVRKAPNKRSAEVVNKVTSRAQVLMHFMKVLITFLLGKLDVEQNIQVVLMELMVPFFQFVGTLFYS